MSAALLSLISPFLLFFLVLLCLALPLLSQSVGSSCPSSSPSASNVIGCQLSQFSAGTPFLYPTFVAFDSTASPPTLLVGSSQFVSVFFLNGTFLKSLGGPFSVSSVVVDSAGYVFLMDANNGLLCFSPYPSYALIANFLPFNISNPFLTYPFTTTAAAAITPQGEFLYSPNEQSITVYRLSFNGSVPTGVVVVGSLPVGDALTSVQIHPITGQVCAYRASAGVLLLYNATYTNNSAPTYTLAQVYNTGNSALSVLALASPLILAALVQVTSGGLFVFGGQKSVNPDVGVDVVILLMTADGSSLYANAPAATLLLTGDTSSALPSNSYTTPLIASSPDGSLIVVPYAGVAPVQDGAVHLLQGFAGADPSVGSIPVTVFTDYNSSYTVQGTLPSLLTFFSSTHNHSSTSYITSQSGSIQFGVGLASTSFYDTAYLSVLVSVGTSNITLTPLNTQCPSANAAVHFTSLPTGFVQCNYSLSWQQPVQGQVVISVLEQRYTVYPGIFTGSNQYYITIPLLPTAHTPFHSHSHCVLHFLFPPR